MACPFQLSKDGVELQFATNHLGTTVFLFLIKLENSWSTFDLEVTISCYGPSVSDKLKVTKE